MKTKSNLNGLWTSVLTPMIFPLLLYANNLGQARLNDLWRPLAFSVLFSLLVFAVFCLFNRDMAKAGLATALVDVAAFSYGHIYNLIEKITVFGVLIGRHRYLTIVISIIVIGLIWLIWKRIKDPEDLVKVVNIVALVLFVFQAGRIASYEITSYVVQKRSVQSVNNEGVIPELDNKRDIYLIILDGYMRSDYLYDTYGYDNSAFLEQLEDMGFYVVPCSRSNYAYTIQSMASELNMNYLEELDLEYEEIDMSNRLIHSEVRNILERQDYEIVAFGTGYQFIEMEDADQYIKASKTEVISDFEALYLETTFLGGPFHYYQTLIFDTYYGPIINRYDRVNTVFTALENSIPSESPLFVYAHILAPHGDMSFTSTGKINLDWESDMDTAVEGTYTFLENWTLSALQAILANSEQEPIIILQSDHGDTYVEGYRNLNLNAYYLPEAGDQELYPTITPVNTFRLIFDYYFGMDYPLLPDKVYASPEGSRNDFTLVEDPYENCAVQSSH